MAFEAIIQLRDHVIEQVVQNFTQVESWEIDLFRAISEHDVTEVKELPRTVRVGILQRYVRRGADGEPTEPDVAQFMYSCDTFGPDAVAQCAQDGLIMIRQLSVQPGQQYRSLEETVLTLQNLAEEGGWRNE